jgi:glycogen debranching enzyme
MPQRVDAGSVTWHLSRCRRVTAADCDSALRALYDLCDTEPTVRARIESPPLAATATDDNRSAELTLYEALFGRDSLRVVDLLWPRRPDLAEAVVLTLAGLQGVRSHEASEEEPGRIAHEVRDPWEVRAPAPGHPGRYYGSIDATPLFCTMAVRLARRDPRVLARSVEAYDGTVRPLADHLARAVRWTLRRLDRSPVGLLESVPAHEHAIENQVWKDSFDSYSHHDGHLATVGTVASVEVQGLVHDALLAVAELIDDLGEGLSPLGLLDPAELRGRAAHIRAYVLDRFWVEDERGPYLALALDRDDEGTVRALRALTSNMGHLLDSRLLDGDDVADRREAVVRALFAPDLLSAAGVRTLSAFEVRFWPAAYHNGSSWPWDTYVIARGLHRHGFHGLAWELKRRVWEVCRRHRCFPEFTAGTDELEPEPNDRILDLMDATGTRNRLEQPPQEIQAWTVAAVVAAKAQWADAVLRRPAALPWRAVEPALAAVEAALLAEPAPAPAPSRSGGGITRPGA